MSTLAITHTRAEGTLIEGTTKSDTTVRGILKANRWRWGRSIDAWFVPQSRDRNAKSLVINPTVQQLRDAGYTVTVDIDDTARPAADVVADQDARQADRAAALADKADRRHRDADTAEARRQQALAAVPPDGQPILVGHHSEKRHRRAIDKAWSTLGASVQADRAADEADRRAEVAASTTEHRHDPGVVSRRLDKLRADLRRSERARDGHTRTLFTDAHGHKHTETTGAATGVHRERVLARIAELTDTIAYWQRELDDARASGVVLFDKTMIRAGDWVHVRGQWREVVRVNPKTVTCNAGMPWPLKSDYSVITAVRDNTGREVTYRDGIRQEP